MKKNKKTFKKLLTKSHRDDNIIKSLVRHNKIAMERYRSGHNGAVLKTVRRQRHRGSNPLLSAKIGEHRKMLADFTDYFFT